MFSNTQLANASPINHLSLYFPCFREEAKRIAKDKEAYKMKIVPMHGSLPASEQVGGNLWPMLSRGK